VVIYHPPTHEKVLPQALSLDAERLRRFEQEALGSPDAYVATGLK
jgi:hypothetical protein